MVNYKKIIPIWNDIPNFAGAAAHLGRLEQEEAL